MPGPAGNVFMALSVSYMDRMAASDVTRASILLSKIAEIWPDFRATWAAEAGVSVQNTPSALPSIWDGSMRTIIASSLPDGGSEAIRAKIRQIASTAIASQLGPLARTYLEYIAPGSASRSFAARVAMLDIGTMPTELDAMISGAAAGETFNPPTPPGAGALRMDAQQIRNIQRFAIPSQQDFLSRALAASGSSSGGGSQSAPLPGPGTTVLEDIMVTGQVRTVGIPTWGWVVGGLVVATGLGIFAYRKWGSS